jgi:peptide chain release factor 2
LCSSGTPFDLPSREAAVADLERRMAEPSFWDDPETSRKVVTQLKAQKAVVGPLTDVLRQLEDLQTLHELAAAEHDDETMDEVDRDAGTLQEAVDRLELATLLNGPHDQAACYFSIQAGAGGTDAQDWAEMLLRMFLRYFERNGYDVAELERTAGEEAGIKSVSLHVTGPYAYGYLSCERGVHRLVRPSPFNADNKRQTSFAAVTVLPELDDIEVEIDWDKDVREDVYRSSGAGGQHVNKTSSAIRLTHLPTNSVVQCQNERSQHQNRAVARKMLTAKLFELEQRKRDSDLAKLYGDKGQIAWGNQIRSYVLDDRRVKDHRTGAETFNPDRVLDGDIQMFIDAYLRKRAGKK